MDRGRVLHVGKIVGIFGVYGELKVVLTAAETGHFDPGRSLMLREKEGWYTPLTVRTVKVHKNTLRVRFEEIGDRDAAERRVGANLYIPREALPEIDDDTWYWCDLIGLEVYDTEDVHIGRVTSMIETGANDVFVVTKEGGEILIPAIASVVRDIDPESGRMRVDLPEGLE